MARILREDQIPKSDDIDSIGTILNLEDFGDPVVPLPETVIPETDLDQPLELSPEEKFDFKPGQYCTIGTGGIERAYSIASSPDEDQIELFVELVPPPDGNLTPLLNDLKVGEAVTIRPRAKGIFVKSDI